MTDARTQVRLRPVIRVFVSSTFSDMKHERNALEADAFPKLEQLCERHGFQFQAIDLRWGVSTEAGMDHRTMRICFDELRRAREISPRPNFLILLGNRYGWRPLPEEISVEEFHTLEHAAAQIPDSAGKSVIAALREWYRKDTNAVPPVYLLQSRRQDLGDDKDYTHDEIWNQVQEVLWTIINRAMPSEQLQRRFDVSAPVGSIPAILRFQSSATEQEIWRGALSVPDAEEHVLAYFREIENLTAFSDPKKIEDFVDVDSSGSVDVALQAEQDRLKAEIRQRLGSANVFRNESPARLVEAQEHQGGRDVDVTTDHLAQLCADVVSRLTEIIQGQIEEYWRNTAQASMDRAARELEIEQREYERFAKERGDEESFVGRQGELRAVLDYIGRDSRWPLVIHGPSGCGKTALLARASQEVAKTRRRTERFIGVAPRSSDLRSLLSSLCQELRQRNSRTQALPSEIKDLRDEFFQHLQTATPEQPLIIFLDALDQLSDADGGRLLDWLPLGTLPAHVKLVVSCLSDQYDGDPADQPHVELKSRQIPAGNFINLDVLSEAEARLLLFNRWLPKADRTVSDDQRARIKQSLASPACRQPIFLKLLFEEVVLWHSYDAAPLLGKSVNALLEQLFRRLRQPTNHDPLLVNRVLGYLSASRHGLAENEILEILYADPEYRVRLNEVTEQTQHELPPNAKRIPIALWCRLRFDLAPYLTERAAPGANVLTWFHREVAEWVKGSLAEPPDQSWQPHHRMADYFDSRWPIGDHHALHEIVYQLSGARRLDLLEALLGRFEFLLRRASGNMNSGSAGVYDLTEDLDRILEVCDDSETARLLVRKVMDFHAMLGMNAPFLSMFPAALTQCCLNSVSESVRELAEAALGSLDFPERLWAFSSRRFGYRTRQAMLLGHTQGVSDCCLADGDTTVVSVADLDPAILWDASTGRIVRMVDAGRIPPSATSIAARSFGNLVQTMATDNRIALLEAHRLHLLNLAGTLIRTVEFEVDRNARIGVASDSRFFVSVHHEIWEMNENGEVLHTFREHVGNESVDSLAVTPDGSHLVSVDGSGLIVLRARRLGSWDVLWESVAQYEPECGYALFLRDVEEWDWNKQTYVGADLLVGLDSSATTVALAVAGRMQVFDARSRERLMPMMRTSSTFFLERVGLDREFAFFGGRRGAARCVELFAIDSRTRRVVPTLLQDEPTCASISADGGTIVVGSCEKDLIVADITRPKQDAERKVPKLPSDWIIGVTLSRDEEYVACWSIDHWVVVWHARSGHIRYRWNGRERRADAGDRLNDVQFSPNGNWLAITRGRSKKCRTLIVDLTTEQLIFDTKRVLGYVDDDVPLPEKFLCRFSPDGIAAAILTHHELWIVNLSRSEVEFRVDIPALYGDVSMDWSDAVLIRHESMFGVAYYRFEPETRVLEDVDAASIEANGRFGEQAYPVATSGDRSVSMTEYVSHGGPPVFTRIVLIRDQESEWRYAMPAAVTFVGLAPKSGYVVVGDRAGNFTALWPREGAAD